MESKNSKTENRGGQEYQRTLLDCIGKIEVTSNTDPYTIACLMKSRPHTFKLDGKYV